jgi:branched-chain amino acid transport system permease protein
MLYREAGQFKTSYQKDWAVFPIFQDRVVVWAIVFAAFFIVPVISSEYWLGSIIIPFLVLSLSAIGLNILTGYAGQLSLGTAGFMAVGAFASYNFMIRVPALPVVVDFLLGGACAALVGFIFGLPSLRIKGFYLAVATLAAQFFIEWVFTHIGWFTNYSASGVISAPQMFIMGYEIKTPIDKYFLTLVIVTVMAMAAKNMVRSSIGRAWCAVRDRDIAAEVIGIKLMQTKLSAFAVSSFYCGVAGALWTFCFLGTVEPAAFDLNRSFQVLFMIIIGGAGSILGSFLGAGFILLFPILLNNLAAAFGGQGLQADTLSHLEHIIFGGLIIFFLIVEPHGLARLWQIAKEKLRLWPFPY